MKRITMLFAMILAVGCFAQEAAIVDTVKQEAPEIQVNPVDQELTARNEKVENAFIGVYLQAAKKDIGPAFMDLYLSAGELEKQNIQMKNMLSNVQAMVNEIQKVKQMKELDVVLKKYGIERIK